MVQVITKPFVATAQFADWEQTLAELNNFVARLVGDSTASKVSYWAILENAFEIHFTFQKIPELLTLGFADRGRVFWNEAEIQFRRDNSRPHNPYRMVLVADQPPPNFNLKNFSPFDLDYLEGDWKKADEFQQVLWGDALEDSWFTSRIPGRRKYEGENLSPKAGRVAVIKGVEYRCSGELEFYRFNQVSDDEIRTAPVKEEE